MCRSFGDFKPLSERVKASGIKLVCQVQTIEQAAAVVPLGADAVVAQVPQSNRPINPHGISIKITLREPYIMLIWFPWGKGGA